MLTLCLNAIRHFLNIDLHPVMTKGWLTLPSCGKGWVMCLFVFLCAGKTYGSGPGDLPPNPITQLSDAKSPLMALHVPELRMMMLANESSADIPYWN